MWIGDNVIILLGVTIGQNVIIGLNLLDNKYVLKNIIVDSVLIKF